MKANDFNKTYICVYKMAFICSIDFPLKNERDYSFNSKHLHISKLLVSLVNEDIFLYYGLVMT